MSDRFWRWYEKANDIVRTFTGPAQIGAGHPEPPDIRPTDPDCPLCNTPLSRHEIIRAGDGHTPTRLICPLHEARA